MRKSVLKKFKGQIIVLVFLIFLTAIANTFSGYSMRFILEEFEKPEPQLQGLLINISITAISYLGLIAAIWTTAYYRIKLKTKMRIHWRDTLAEKISEQDYASYAHANSASYMSWLTNDVKEIDERSFTSFFDLLQGIFSFITNGIAIFTLNPWLLLGTVIATAVMFLVPMLVNNINYKAAQDMTKNEEVLNSKTKNLTQGFTELYMLNGEYYFQNSLAKTSMAYDKSVVKEFRIRVGVVYFNQLLTIIAMISLSALAVYLYLLGQAPLGSAISVLNLSGGFMRNIGGALGSFMTYKSSDAIWDKFKDLFVEKAAPNYKNLGDNFVISTDNLSFKYENAEETLEYPDIRIDSKKKYLLQGPNGSGKSTLLRVLSRLEATTNGEVQFNNTNLQNIDKKEIFSSISYLHQDGYLLTASIRENLSFSQEYSDEEIYVALEQVDMLNFVEEQPNGLDYVLKEEGSNLSGGQRQRLILARHILRNKQFYFLDEITSNLDKKSKNDIETAFLEQNELGLIMVNHTPPSADKFDEVISLG